MILKKVKVPNDAASLDVTQHKQTENESMLSFERLKTLIEEVPVGICTTDIKGKVTYVNKTFEEASGYSRERVVGKNGFKLGIFSNEALELLRKRAKEKLMGRPPGILETQFKCADGHLIRVEIKGKILKEHGMPVGFQIISRDVNERKRAEEALRESEKRYRDLADLLPQTVFELDERANLIFANRNAFGMFCYSQEDFDKGLSAIQMFIPEDRDRAKENVQRRLRGEKFSINEYTALRKDGATFPALVYSAPIIHEGKPIGLRGIVVDITDHKLLERELRERNERLDVQNEELQS